MGIILQEVVDSVSYTTGSCKMIFTVSYFVYSINYLVCLARTNWGEVTMHGFMVYNNHPCPRDLLSEWMLSITYPGHRKEDRIVKYLLYPHGRHVGGEWICPGKMGFLLVKA